MNLISILEKKFQKNTWNLSTLGEISTEVTIGSEISRDQLGTGDYPSIKAGDVNSGLPLQFCECISFVNA